MLHFHPETEERFVAILLSGDLVIAVTATGWVVLPCIIFHTNLEAILQAMLLVESDIAEPQRISTAIRPLHIFHCQGV